MKLFSFLILQTLILLSAFCTFVFIRGIFTFVAGTSNKFLVSLKIQHNALKNTKIPHTNSLTWNSLIFFLFYASLRAFSCLTLWKTKNSKTHKILQHLTHKILQHFFPLCLIILQSHYLKISRH